MFTRGRRSVWQHCFSFFPKTQFLPEQKKFRQETPNFQNLPFKDIYFTLIDLQDRVNVKFEKIDSSSIEEE